MENGLEIIQQLIAVSNIANVFRLNVGDFLTLILGSFIVGSICLTFYYKVYDNNELWTNLDFVEKTIVSSVIGFLSILPSLYLVTLFRLILANKEEFEYLFLQLNYIAPFLYFIVFSSVTAKHKGLDFIKKYIAFSIEFIIFSAILFTLGILLLIKAWNIIFWTILPILIIIIVRFIYQRYLSPSSAESKK